MCGKYRKQNKQRGLPSCLIPHLLIAKYPAIVTALFLCPSSNPMFLTLYPLHYRICFPFVLPFAPKDPPSFTEKFEKSFMVLLLVPRVVAVELGMKLFSICFHIQLPPPPPEKGVTDHVCNTDRKNCFKYFFFHDVRISKQ